MRDLTAEAEALRIVRRQHGIEIPYLAGERSAPDEPGKLDIKHARTVGKGWPPVSGVPPEGVPPTPQGHP